MTQVKVRPWVLPQWGGGLVRLGYAGAFARAAVLTTLNRDVA